MNFVMEMWDQVEWLRHFRMNQETFNEPLDVLEPQIMQHRTAMREPKATNKRVAVTLW